MAEERHATLADYAAVVRRKAWIIVLAALITTGAAFYISSREHPAYTATAQVLVNPNSDLASGAGSAQSDAQARYDSTQAQIAHALPVAVAAVRGTGTAASDLLHNSSVSADSTSNVLSFHVTQGNPANAVALVNRYAHSFTNYRRQLDQQAINLALLGLAKQVKTVKQQFTEAKATGQYLGLIRQDLNKLIDHQQNLLELRSQTTGGAIVSSAATHAPKTRPNTDQTAALAAAVGVVLGVVLVFALEAFDTRIRSSEEIGEHLGVPMLARIPTPPRALRKNNRLALLDNDYAEHGEAYRKLLVAIDFANLAIRGKIIMITSATEKEGKSTTTANLAVAMARTGRRVACVDLDLRRPFLDKLLDVPSEPGISNVALGYVSLDEALSNIELHEQDAQGPDKGSQALKAEDGSLAVLAAGTPVPVPSDFVGTQIVGDLLARLADSHDVVLVDSAPILPVSDSLILSRWVDAQLIVSRSTSAKRPLVRELRRTLSQSSAPILGYVVTAAEGDAGYGGRYGYGYQALPTPGRDDQGGGSSRVGFPSGTNAPSLGADAVQGSPPPQPGAKPA